MTSPSAGEKVQELTITGTCGRRNTGTRVRFWPEGATSIRRASRSQARAPAQGQGRALPGPHHQVPRQEHRHQAGWCYEDGLKDYLIDAVKQFTCLPEQPFVGSFSSEQSAVDWACAGCRKGRMPRRILCEPYSHRARWHSCQRPAPGAARRHARVLRVPQPLAPEVKLTPEDIWDRCAYILSIKMRDPQFAGQTKERLSSRQSSAFVSGVVKDAFSLYLNSNTELAERLAELCISSAQRRMRAAKTVVRKKITQGPALPGKADRCGCADPMQGSSSWWRVTPAGGSAKQAQDREFQAIMPCAARS